MVWGHRRRNRGRRNEIARARRDGARGSPWEGDDDCAEQCWFPPVRLHAKLMHLAGRGLLLISPQFYPSPPTATLSDESLHSPHNRSQLTRQPIAFATATRHASKHADAINDEQLLAIPSDPPIQCVQHLLPTGADANPATRASIPRSCLGFASAYF